MTLTITINGTANELAMLMDDLQERVMGVPYPPSYVPAQAAPCGESETV